MKMMKRLSAILIAVLLMVSMMAVPASAAEGSTDTGASITISGTASGAIYDVYKIFDVEVTGSEGSKSYFYTPTTDWVDFFTTGQGRFYGNISAETGYIIWTDTNLFTDTTGAQIKQFTAHALTYAEGLATTTKSATATTTTVTIDGLDKNAYYLIDSSVGSGAMANTVYADNISIEEKNDASELPTISKLVDGATTKSVNMGQTFIYTITVGLNEAVAVDDTTGISLTLTDIMPAHVLVEAGSFMATLNNVEGSLTKGTDYVVKNAHENGGVDSTTGTQTHIVDFKKAFAAGDVLVFTYKAKLVPFNNARPTEKELYANLATIAYGTKHVEAFASVTTFSVNGYKYFYDDQGIKTALANAEFQLKKTENNQTLWYRYDQTNNEVEWTSNQTDADTVKSDEQGMFKFYGIAAGDYTLVETQAPSGFTGKDETPVTVNATLLEVEIENVKGSTAELPTTGGIGTTIFYAVGGVLVIGALSLLIVRKRTTAK